MHLKLTRRVRALREPFGTAGLIVAAVALVMALGGGAYAASGGLTGKQTKEVKKIAQAEAKKLQGTGPAGAPGPAGIGSPGPKGEAGQNGTAGAPGANGKSVTVGSAGGSECGGRGGATVQVEGEPVSKKSICNGQTGFTPELPEGETETGFWNSVPGEEAFGSPSTVATISFNIPTPTALTPHFNDVGYTGTPSDDCPGTAGEPQAAEGQLCVYTTGTLKETTLGVAPIFYAGSGETTPQGTTMVWAGSVAGNAFPAEQIAFGTYAATP